MRLFRRALLCLIIGITAFGVAGWAWRPRASWTVVVPMERGFVQSLERDPAQDAAFWIYGVEQSTVAGVLSKIDVEARDPSTGRLLTKIELPGDHWPTLVSDDSLLVATKEIA